MGKDGAELLGWNPCEGMTRSLLEAFLRRVESGEIPFHLAQEALDELMDQWNPLEWFPGPSAN